MNFLDLVKHIAPRRAKAAVMAQPSTPRPFPAHPGPRPVSSARLAPSLRGIWFLLLALLLGSMLLCSPPAQAQTGDVLVSNTGQTSAQQYSLTSNFPKRAQKFTAGSAADVSSVGISFGVIANAASPETELTVTINVVSGNDPGSVHCELDNPASISQSSVSYFSASDCTLYAGTDYFVVIERTAGFTQFIGLDSTSSDSEDASSATGWSIANVRHYFDDSGNTWDTSASAAYQIDVRGQEVELPPTITTDASMPVSNHFRVTLTFFEDVTAPKAGDIRGWYSGTHYSFDLTSIRQEDAAGRVFSALAGKILDGTLKIIYETSLLSVTVDAPAYGSEPAGASVWSATMTAGDSAADNPGASGFVGYAKDSTIDDLGSIDDNTFTFRGTEFTVEELVHTPAWGTVDLRLSAPLPTTSGVSLHLGNGRWLQFGDRSLVTMTSGDGTYRWEPVLLEWEDEDSISVAIKSTGGL